jgi:hypothetical protein
MRKLPDTQTAENLQLAAQLVQVPTCKSISDGCIALSKWKEYSTSLNMIRFDLLDQLFVKLNARF